MKQISTNKALDFSAKINSILAYKAACRAASTGTDFSSNIADVMYIFDDGVDYSAQDFGLQDYLWGIPVRVKRYPEEAATRLGKAQYALSRAKTEGRKKRLAKKVAKRQMIVDALRSLNK